MFSLTLAYANDWNSTRLLGSGSFAMAALFCGGVFYMLHRRWMKRERPVGRGLWLVLALVQLALLAEVQLSLRFDLGSWLRDSLRDQGMYETRRGLQALILVAVAVVGILASGGILYRLRKQGRHTLWGVGGTLWSLGLFILPVVSLHQIDRLLYHHIGPVMFIGLLWAVGASCVIYGAFGLISQLRVSPADWRRPGPRGSKRDASFQRFPHQSTSPQAHRTSGRRV